MDKIEKLTEANEDRTALEHTIARLTTRHFEEAERRRAAERKVEVRPLAAAAHVSLSVS